MADLPSTLRGSRKLKKELSLSKTSLYSGNSTISEGNGGRPTSLSTFRHPKLVSNISFEKSSCNKERDTAVYESYEIKYGTYLLKKLQNQVLEKSKKNNEENFKKCLVSLKMELEECLKKNVHLNNILLHAETYIKIIKECNKRIHLGEITKVFKENKVENLFESISNIVDPAINQLRLIGLNKNEVQEYFTQDLIGEKSELIECLKRIQNYSEKNRENIKNIAEELTKFEGLLQENIVLRERHNKILKNITSRTLATNYETLAETMKKVIDRRFNSTEDTDSNFFKLFKIDEVLSATEKPFSPEVLNALELSDSERIFGEKPVGTSTPQP